MIRGKGFSLVEILIVVMILGIIAAVAVPRFSNASAVVRANMLAEDVRLIRMQIGVFKGQHKGVAPGYPNCDKDQAPTAETFIAHLTQASDVDGRTAAPETPGYRLGPYFREMPVNPVNGRATVQIVADGEEFPSSPDDSHGYIYQPSTLTFKPDSAGEDEGEKAFFDY